MKVTLAHPISSMSGSVDHQTGAKPAETVKTSGLTFFVWKSLQLARMLVLPANPRTIFQAAVRNVQTGLSRAWSASLDAEQRLAWKAWAALHSYVDGFQAFQATAWAPYAYNGTLIEDAPATAAPAFAATLASATYDISSKTITCVWTGVSMDPAQDVITHVEWTAKSSPARRPCAKPTTQAPAPPCRSASSSTPTRRSRDSFRTSPQSRTCSTPHSRPTAATAARPSTTSHLASACSGPRAS